MSEITLKMKAEALSKSLENLAPLVEGELQQAVQNLAEAAYASMVSQVQGMGMNPKNRQDYLRGLNFQTLSDDNYLIYLDGEWANKLESGFPAYDMKEVLLNSNKMVGVGTRSGQKWVQTNKQGKKFAHIPFEHKPFSKEKSTGDLASDIKNMTAFNKAGVAQSITKTFKDLDGNPISGKVATAISTESTPKNLQGLTKYQYVSDKGKVSSMYMTFRTISENSNGFQHPGFKGYNLFKQLEEFVDREMENIIKTILGD